MRRRMNRHPKSWKKLSSNVLLKNVHLSIAEDIVLLPNGAKKTYVRFAPGQDRSVIVIALNSDNKILIQKEYSYPPNKIMWQLPGGSVKSGESIKVAANRELAEESGYSSKKVKVLGHFYTNNRLSDQKQYVVLSTELFAFKLPEDKDEFIDTFWLTKEEITTKIASGEFDNINLLAALNLWFHVGEKVKVD